MIYKWWCSHHLPMTAPLLTTLISLQTGGSVSHTVERKMIAWHFIYESYTCLLYFINIFIKITPIKFRKTKRIIWWSDSPPSSQEIRYNVLNFNATSNFWGHHFHSSAFNFHMHMCTCMYVYFCHELHNHTTPLFYFAFLWLFVEYILFVSLFSQELSVIGLFLNLGNLK